VAEDLREAVGVEEMNEVAEGGGVKTLRGWAIGKANDEMRLTRGVT
jgi:hypothetical protein